MASPTATGKRILLPSDATEGKSQLCLPSEKGSRAWEAVHYWKWCSSQNTTIVQANDNNNKDIWVEGKSLTSQEWCVQSPNLIMVSLMAICQKLFEIIKFLLLAQKKICPLGAGILFFSVPPTLWLPYKWSGHQLWRQTWVWVTLDKWFNLVALRYKTCIIMVIKIKGLM